MEQVLETLTSSEEHANLLRGAMIVCAVCGTARAAANSACARCRTAAAPEPSGSARQRARGRAVTRKAPARATDERKQATILFCDVCGATEKIQHLDVEEARDYLAEATQLMRDAAQSYGGNIYRVEGDGVLAVFGAPLGQEDQALRAGRAAIEIQRRVAARAGARCPLVVRVGIHSGEVIVWKESRSQAERVDGKSIHLAKRIEEWARPGTVVLSGATYRLVEPELDAKPLDVQTIRDFGPIELWELQTMSALSAVDPLARRRVLAPLIGRKHALNALDLVTHQVRAGRLRIVGLRGEAGIGKTRVALEYARQLRTAGFREYWICGRAYATHVPYGLAADLIRALMGLPDAEPARQRDAARAIVANWPLERREDWQAAADLLDIGEHDSTLGQSTPAQRQRRVRDTVFELIAEHVRAGPVLIVVDDIYLADRESQRLLEALARRLEHMPVLICATYRQDFVHRWTSMPAFNEHWIGPLQSSEMAGLAHALLGSDPSLESVIPALVERADGNPFFLEQMAMTLVDDGTLVGTPGFYRCVRHDSDLRVPASITAVIGARVDRLSAAAKAALEAAAIIGQPISGATVGAMQGIAQGAAEEHLRTAQSSGLLIAIAAEPGEAARFEYRHSLVQEAVAAPLTRPRRRALHRAAFEALRQLYPEQLAERASVLAHHAYHGEAWSEAAEFALKAMARSITRSAYRDALRVFALGLDASQRLADPQARLRSELLLRMKALGAQLPLGQSDNLIANLEQAEAIAKELSDARRQSAILLQLAVVLWTRGSYRQGLAVAHKAADTATTSGNPSARMAALQARMLLHHGLGLYGEVLSIARAIEQEFAAELGTRQIMSGWAVIASVNIKLFVADVLWRMARYDEAQQACDEAYLELAHHEHAFSRALVDFVQAEVWSVRGRHFDACGLLKTTLASCKVNDLATMYPPILAALAGSMARCGQAAEAVSVLERAIADEVPLAGGRYNAYYFPRYLAIALREAHRIEDAVRAAEQAREAAAACEQQGHEADALVLLADLQASAGRVGEALAHYDEAIAIARRLHIDHVIRCCQEGIERASTGQVPIGSIVVAMSTLYGVRDGD